MKTASKHEGTAISLTGRHLGRLVRGERSGNRPNPVTRRALQHTFNRPVDELLGPYIPGDSVSMRTHDAVWRLRRYWAWRPIGHGDS